jgi:hypothetical protein
MFCREVSLLLSTQLDHRMRPDQQARLQAHLSHCPECRLRSVQLRCLRDEMSRMPSRLPSAEMAAQIVASLQREARRRADRLEAWQMRLFSQSIGACVSVAMLLLLALLVYKPFYRAMELFKVVTETARIEMEMKDSDEVIKLALTLKPPLPNNPRPDFYPSGALLGFSRNMPDNELIVAVAKVGEDGRAPIARFVEPPSSPELETQLSRALVQQVSFTPAARRGRLISSDVVLMFSKMNIRASL